MAAPFLKVDDFAEQLGRALTEGEDARARRGLQVMSDWIRGQKPDVDPDAAAEVVFEVVRDAIEFGNLHLLSSFQNTTSRRTKAGTFDPAARVLDDLLSVPQRMKLGLPVAARPAYVFGD